MQPAPIVTIAKKNKYKISEFYLEEFYQIAPNIVSVQKKITFLCFARFSNVFIV